MKWWIFGAVFGILLVIGFGSLFYNTGGRGLVRIVKPYLLADIPDKRYGWVDFIPSKSTKRVSGFYSPQLSGENGVAIWTLAGLKRFYHKSNFSVYYHLDVCGAVNSIKREIEDKGIDSASGRSMNDMQIKYFDVAKWRENMKAEYLITVQWDTQEDRRVIDKLWSVSGKYRVLGQVGGGVCD